MIRTEAQANQALAETSARMRALSPTPAELARAAARQVTKRGWLARLLGR